MNTLFVKLTKILLLICVCLLSMQQASKAQWIDEEKTDYYASEAQQFQVLSQSLDILEKADFAKDFQLAIKKGDMRFLAVRGAATMAPGVTDQQLVDAYNNRGQGAKVLKGTTDTLPPSLAQRVGRAARDYMAPYNRLLLDLVSRRQASKKPAPSAKRSKQER